MLLGSKSPAIFITTSGSEFFLSVIIVRRICEKVKSMVWRRCDICVNRIKTCFFAISTKLWAVTLYHAQSSKEKTAVKNHAEHEKGTEIHLNCRAFLLYSQSQIRFKSSRIWSHSSAPFPHLIPLSVHKRKAASVFSGTFPYILPSRR